MIVTILRKITLNQRKLLRLFDHKNTFSDLYQHRFVKSVATLQAVGIIGTFIQAVLGIFLARLLQPEHYGIYALAFGLSSLIFISTGVQETVLVALGKTYTQNDHKGTKEALQFFVNFTGIFVIITLVIAAFLPLISHFFYKDVNIGFYAAIVVVASSVSSTIFALTTTMLQVAGKIKNMAALILVDQVLRFSLSLLFVILGFGIVGAMAGHLVGAIVICVISLIVWKVVRKQYPIFPPIGELFRIKIRGLRSYFQFSLWATLDKNIAGLYGVLPVLMIGIYVVATEVSFFKLALGFMGLALSLLGPISVLLNFEFPRMQLENLEQLRHNFIKISRYSLILSAVLALGAVVTAPFVFRFLYGVNFLPSIKYVFGLFIYGALFGIGVGLGPMWRSIDRIKTSILINVIVLGAGIPLGLWLIKSYGLWGGVIMVTLWYTISHFVSFAILSRILRQGTTSRRTPTSTGQ